MKRESCVPEVPWCLVGSTAKQYRCCSCWFATR
jgi:hypothetical protein